MSDPATAAPPSSTARRRGYSLFGSMTLRWRLVIAFLSVSAIPVLIASLAVADLIANLFGQNMERWLQDASMYVAQQSDDDHKEVEQIVSIIAASLSNQGENLNKQIIEMSADLLGSAGYDSVAIYDDAGTIIFGHGIVGDGKWLPRQHKGRFYVVNDHGRSVLLLGARKKFMRGGQTYYAFVGNRWDGPLVNLARATPALRVQVYTVGDGLAAPLDVGGQPIKLPKTVLEQLLSGASSATARMLPSDSIAAGFSALRDTDGSLVGVVACRMSNEMSLLSHVRTLELFLLLAGLAGVLSLGVALSLSKLISRPLSQLTQALRRVHEGDYSTRVAVEGGRELAQLAAGFNDMTEQLDTLRRRESLVRRREKLAVLGEAAAVLAHEIRNPLGIIKTSSQVLRMKAALPPASEKLIGFVLDEVGRIEGLVRELLDYARPKAVGRHPVDVAAVLKGVLDFTAAELARRNIAVTVTGDGSNAVVTGDGAQLHQAFLNILLNAMDAMPNGGTLTVTCSTDGGEVAVAITDTGSGVAAEVRDRLFDPFVTTKRRGTGLGLARVRDVMEQHGGSVQCDSAPGVGTTFTLRLPKHPDRQGDAP